MRVPELNQRVVAVLADGRRFGSRVAEAWDNGLIEIAPPSDGRATAVLIRGDSVALEWTCARGLARGLGTVVDFVDERVPIVKVQLESSAIGQRRDHVRVETAVDVDIRQAASVPVRCTTIDISGGGLRVRVPLWLMPEEQVNVVLHLPDQAPLPAVARVIRGDQERGYAMGFADIDEVDHERLIAFVFAAHTREFSSIRRS